MACLIVQTCDGIELGRHPIDAQERYAYYRQFGASDPLIFAHRSYRIVSIAWSKPQQELMIRVGHVDAPVPSSDVED